MAEKKIAELKDREEVTIEVTVTKIMPVRQFTHISSQYPDSLEGEMLFQFTGECERRGCGGCRLDDATAEDCAVRDGAVKAGPDPATRRTRRGRHQREVLWPLPDGLLP